MVFVQAVRCPECLEWLRLGEKCTKNNSLNPESQKLRNELFLWPRQSSIVPSFAFRMRRGVWKQGQLLLSIRSEWQFYSGREKVISWTARRPPLPPSHRLSRNSTRRQEGGSVYRRTRTNIFIFTLNRTSHGTQ